MNGHAKGKDRPPHKLGQDDLTMGAKGVNGIYTNAMDTLTASTRLQNHRRPSSLWHGMSTARGHPSTPPRSCGPFSTRAGPTLPLQHLRLPFAGQEARQPAHASRGHQRGHSSGEIAAAYAAGGLSARDAIIVSFPRGLAVTKHRSRKGAMAALGMSWEAARKHLVPGVVLACDNAPNSVTISGDAGPLIETVDRIKKSVPGVLATILKVDKAYHSPHMEEIGAEYHAAMTNAGVVGKVHTVPFF
ncbi:hypothetical protein McanMca71_007930 [Microsporum canis]